MALLPDLFVLGFVKREGVLDSFSSIVCAVLSRVYLQRVREWPDFGYLEYLGVFAFHGEEWAWHKLL